LTVAGATYLRTVLVKLIRKATARHGHTSWLTDDINRANLTIITILLPSSEYPNFFYILICSQYYQYNAMLTKAVESTEININTHA
jgi:hypothetical protein